MRSGGKGFLLARKRDVDYVYATARVRALEQGLLRSGQADALLDARTNDEILKFLAGMGYDTSGIEADSPDFYEQAISRKREDVFQMVNQFTPQDGLFDYFLYLYDYHNLKVLIKSGILQQNSDYLLMNAGAIPVPDMRKAVLEQIPGVLTPAMEEGIAAARQAYGRSQNPQMVDIVLDRACFADMLSCAKTCKSEFVVSFIRLQIDLTNLKSFLRLKKMEASEEFASEVFVPGGDIGLLVWEEAFQAGLQGAAEKLKMTELGKLFETCLPVFREPGGIARVELWCDNQLMEYMRGAKYITFGIEPLVAYLYAMENEFKTLKILIAGKLSGMEAGKIKERMRESYV